MFQFFTVQLYFYIPTFIGLLDLVSCRANSDCKLHNALVRICILSCAVFSLNCVKNGAEKSAVTREPVGVETSKTVPRGNGHISGTIGTTSSGFFVDGAKIQI